MKDNNETEIVIKPRLYLPSSQYIMAPQESNQLPNIRYNIGINTVEPQTSVASTMVDKYLVKKVNRGMNTDLTKDRIVHKINL